jgi:hypothetical protein
VPTVMTSRRKAAAARMRRDIDTLALALEAYQQTWGMYPVCQPSAPASVSPVRNWDNILVCDQSGDYALYTALAVKGRVRQGGVPYGPFINAEQFRVDVNRGQIQDKDSDPSRPTPFWYVPANPSMPEIRKPLSNGAGSYFAKPQSAAGPQPLYAITCFGPDTTGTLYPDLQKIMGDDGNLTANNGIIDPKEKPSHTGPYLLWHPGPDKKLGLQTMGSKTTTDDVTNFDIPMQYRR